MKKVVQTNLNKKSLENLSKEIQRLAQNLENNITNTTKELGETSLKYMKQEYDQNNISSHKSNLNLSPYNKSYENGFVLSSGDDEIAVYKEFGIGMIGGNNPSKLSGEVGYQYDVNNHGEKGWYYRKDGKTYWTRGYMGSNMFGNLVDELKSSALKKYQLSVSQAINDFGKATRGGK